MTLLQAIEMAFFKQHKIYIEKDSKMTSICHLEDLYKYDYNEEVDEIRFGNRADIIILKGSKNE